MYAIGLDGKVLTSIVRVNLDNNILTFRKNGVAETIGVTKYPDGSVKYYSLEDGPSWRTTNILTKIYAKQFPT